MSASLPGLDPDPPPGPAREATDATVAALFPDGVPPRHAGTVAVARIQADALDRAVANRDKATVIRGCGEALESCLARLDRAVNPARPAPDSDGIDALLEGLAGPAA